MMTGNKTLYTDDEYMEIKLGIERDCRQFRHLYNLSKRDGIPQRGVITKAGEEAYTSFDFTLYMSKDIIKSSKNPMATLFAKTFGIFPEVTDSWKTVLTYSNEKLVLYHDNVLSGWLSKFYDNGNNNLSSMCIAMSGRENLLSVDVISIGRKKTKSIQRMMEARCPWCNSYDIRLEGSDNGVHWNGWRALFSCADCNDTFESGIDGSPYMEFAKNKPQFNFALEDHYPPIYHDEDWDIEV